MGGLKKLIRLRERNQITLPNDVVERLGLTPGDFLLLVGNEREGYRILPTQLVTLNTAKAAQVESAALADADAGRYRQFYDVKSYSADLRARKKKQKQAAMTVSPSVREEVS